MFNFYSWYNIYDFIIERSPCFCHGLYGYFICVGICIATPTIYHSKTLHCEWILFQGILIQRTSGFIFYLCLLTNRIIGGEITSNKIRNIHCADCCYNYILHHKWILSLFSILSHDKIILFSVVSSGWIQLGYIWCDSFGCHLHNVSFDTKNNLNSPII